MNVKRVTGQFLLGCLVFAAANTGASGQQLIWRTDYNAARKEATEKRRPLLIEFGTDHCLWCRKLESTTLNDPAVVRILQSRFIPLKIDAGESPALTQALKIQGFPTLIIAASDGHIITVIEGYVESGKLMDQLQKALGTSAAPDWMSRDYQEANKAIAQGDHAHAVSLLKSIAREDRNPTAQKNALEALAELERQAASLLAQARKLDDQGHTLEVIDMLADLARRYPGTQAGNEAKTILVTLSANPEIRERLRNRRAKELMSMAREEFRSQQYNGCLEKCELLIANYSDRHEAAEATKLAGEIKANPDWLSKACNDQNERLNYLYVSLAETWLKKGKEDEAVTCYQKIQQLFPGTPYARVAQEKIEQLQGKPGERTEFKKAP
jgi:thioredoxin-related protein/outer membrane protein assembly factor BamD (BamD/ComL family)